MSVEEGAELVADEILREAREKASGIFEAARREAKTILDEARFGVKEKEEQLIMEARAKGKSLYEEILADGRLRARKEILKRREELLDEIFKEAQKELRAYTTSKGYERDLVMIAIKACKELGSRDVVIYANERDLKLLEKSKDDLSRGAGVGISLGEPIQTVGGVKVGTPDKTIEIDNTFEGRLRREYDALRTRVAKLLFEGSE